MSIGEKLLNLRKSKNLSQEEVAEKLNVTRQTISKWETDQSSPDFDKILPLCNLYEVSADYLLTGKEGKNIPIKDEVDIQKMRAKGIGLGVFLYIIAVSWIMISIPFLELNPILSCAIFLIICGFATYKIIYTAIVYKNKKEKKKENTVIKQIDNIVSLITVIIYFIVSFMTMAWHITWVLFIVCGLIMEIVKLIFMLKGEVDEK